MCLGKRVIHQRAVHDLAFVVVDQLFPHSLAHALSYSAMNLAVHQHRVDHVSTIVDRDVFVDFDFAGLGVHFH